MVLVNDNRTYGERVGKYKAILEELMPQTIMVTVRQSDGPMHVYDMLKRNSLPTTKTDTGYSFHVELTELGGKIIALYPTKPSHMKISTTPSATRGARSAISVAITDDASKPLPGLQPVRVDVTNAKDNPTEYTGYYCAANGRLQVSFRPAINDTTGTWKFRVEDLTAG